MDRIANILYRPTENHVGVIYRFGRFHRFVDPDHWTFTWPFFESFFDEVKLDMRTAVVRLPDVYTRDRIAVDVDLKVFYLVDLRVTDAERRIQVLRFPTESAWDEIVRTNINDVARNQIFVARNFDELVTQEGRGDLKQALSGVAADRLRGFGILLNARFGVNIVDIQPNAEFKKALMEESAARALGTAAASRLSPLFEQFLEHRQEKAIFALIMEIASAVINHGEVPDVIFPAPNEYPAGGITRDGLGSLLPNVPAFSPPGRKPKSTGA